DIEEQDRSYRRYGQQKEPAAANEQPPLGNVVGLRLCSLQRLDPGEELVQRLRALSRKGAFNGRDWGEAIEIQPGRRIYRRTEEYQRQHGRDSAQPIFGAHPEEDLGCRIGQVCNVVEVKAGKTHEGDTG